MKITPEKIYRFHGEYLLFVLAALFGIYFIAYPESVKAARSMGQMEQSLFRNVVIQGLGFAMIGHFGYQAFRVFLQDYRAGRHKIQFVVRAASDGARILLRTWGTGQVSLFPVVKPTACLPSGTPSRVTIVQMDEEGTPLDTILIPPPAVAAPSAACFKVSGHPHWRTNLQIGVEGFPDTEAGELLFTIIPRSKSRFTLGHEFAQNAEAV